jgi:disulfide bond formation protein DsbB
MSTATMSEFFAILSLLCWAGTIVTIALAVMYRRNPESSAGYLFEDIRANALWFAFAVATVTMLGSLYLSEIAHFVPCSLCWYQRICMYPLSVALLIAAIRRDRGIWVYILAPAFIGTGFAIYHTQLQAFPKQTGPFCKLTEPCNIRYVWEFGFVSIPFMALAAFTFIITMMFVVRSDRSSEYELDPDDDTESEGDDELALSARGAS